MLWRFWRESDFLRRCRSVFCVHQQVLGRLCRRHGFLLGTSRQLLCRQLFQLLRQLLRLRQQLLFWWLVLLNRRWQFKLLLLLLKLLLLLQLRLEKQLLLPLLALPDALEPWAQAGGAESGRGRGGGRSSCAGRLLLLPLLATPVGVGLVTQVLVQHVSLSIMYSTYFTEICLQEKS